MKKLVSVLLALALALGMAGAFAESEALPAYTWNGEDPIWGAVVKYFQENDFGFEPAEGGVLIPTPIILKTEVSEDETEATVWGNFWIFTYSRNAENPKLANAFIRFVLEYDNSLRISEEVGYASANAQVLAELSGPGGTYEGNAAYLPRAGYDKDEMYHDNEVLRKELSEKWIKVKLHE